MAIKTEKTPWRKTPLVESTNLSKAAGCRIFLKLDHLQPGGSFKSRGIGYYCVAALRRANDPSRVHFYSSSGGNAGLACVHAANFLGCPSTVVVPQSTIPMMVVKIRAAGASEVLQYGASWKEADTYLREVVMRRAEEKGEHPIHVPPFDHPDIWEGHTSLVRELDEQLAEVDEDAPDVIVCSVGGGGLLCGIAQSMERVGGGWNNTTILGVETKGADALAKSLEKGEQVTLPRITSIATSLGASRIADRTWEVATKYRDAGRFKNAVLTDGEAAMGSWRFAEDERILVEMACGVNLALCYGGRLKRALGRPVRRDEKVVIVVCGGQAVSTELVEQWRVEYGDVMDGEAINGHLDDVPSATLVPNGA